MVLFVASEIWFIVDNSIALFRMKLYVNEKTKKMTMIQYRGPANPDPSYFFTYIWLSSRILPKSQILVSCSHMTC